MNPKQRTTSLTLPKHLVARLASTPNRSLAVTKAFAEAIAEPERLARALLSRMSHPLEDEEAASVKTSYALPPATLQQGKNLTQGLRLSFNEVTCLVLEAHFAHTAYLKVTSNV